MPSIARWAPLAAAITFLGPAALAQQANPAARGSSPHAWFAAVGRTDTGVVEHVVTGASPFSPDCADRDGPLFVGAEVEPYVSIDPLNPNHLVGAWQQDRYQNGGSRGQVAGASFDG